MIPGITASRRRGGGGGGDPYWANVVALLHLDGANGSTTFNDQKGHTFSNNGSGAALSTAQKRFGPSSLLLNGSSHYIQSGSSTDWDMAGGDFTFEAFIRPAIAVVARMEIFERWSAEGLGFYINSAGLLSAYAQGAGTTILTGANVVSSSTWHHVAYVRDGGTLRIYLDGVQEDSDSFGGAISAITEPLSIGRDNSGSRYFNGNLDELRITKGFCRYPGGTTFTPPAAPFPNS